MQQCSIAVLLVSDPIHDLGHETGGQAEALPEGQQFRFAVHLAGAVTAFLELEFHRLVGEHGGHGLVIPGHEVVEALQLGAARADGLNCRQPTVF